MSALTAVAKVRAYELGRAVPLATRRHVHVSDRPLVFVPLSMAGEANAPLGCLIGTDEAQPRVLVVQDPRNRTQRFAFAAQLAEIVLAYVDGCTVSMVEERGKSVFADAPQLVVANPGGVEFTRLLGRSTRFRRTEGEWPVAPTVPVLGRWLTWFAESTEKPGASTVLALTTVLCRHWATGQSALEDANLAALMGWIAPWDGLTGPCAAEQAEDPAIWPPAGPATDPDFDNGVLAKLIAAYDRALDDTAKSTAMLRMLAVLREQMQPTWHLMWKAIALLRAIPPASTVEKRWLRDRQDFTAIVEYWRDNPIPQARVDNAVRAAQRLDRLERALDEVTVDAAMDDELAMAEFRLSGEAFQGSVVACDPVRTDGTGTRRKLRPHIVVATADPLRLEEGATVRSSARPAQEATVVGVERSADLTWPARVTLELRNGMGRRLIPEPGTVPELGERLCYAALETKFAINATFPKREETPWTHGGPPPPYEPEQQSTMDIATEDWS